MNKTQILVSWIGYADLRAWGATLNEDELKKVKQITGDYDSSKIRSGGPIRDLLGNTPFEKVYLLNNYPVSLAKQFAAWLHVPTEIITVKLDNPTDYKAIYNISVKSLAEIVDSNLASKLCIHLSPGTPSMTAIWVLLGKTKFPAIFYQTYNGKSWITDIPFDLTLDVLPDLIRTADITLQKLVERSPQEVEGFNSIIGDSKAIRLAVGKAEKAAIHDVSVLLLGESGTGKELFARAIHAASRRKTAPFIAVNCAAIPKDLLEAELFGYVKGSFTGASQDREGAFMQASGGTIFLDEIADLDLVLQAKLLRVLQSLNKDKPTMREFQRIGAKHSEQVDVRILAATNKDMIEIVGKNLFREDLYYRLATITVKLPPLRERKSDVGAIAETLLEQINREFSIQEQGYRYKKFCNTANIFVKHYDWPGNVRELYNTILQAVVISSKELITAEDLEMALPEISFKKCREEDVVIPEKDFDLEALLDNIREKYIKKALEITSGVKLRAARLLGFKNYQTLDAQMRRLKIDK
jgi:DNA-binding NtrC family response regulator